MKNVKITIFALICIIMAACSVAPSELDRTIFVPDPDDYNLPAYTEWGYNSFGAVIERDYFVVSQSIIPCKILYQNGTLLMEISGILKSNSTTNMSLSFNFPSDVVCNKYDDLLFLNQKTIDLTAADCVVTMKVGNANADTLQVTGGELYFKHVQLLSIEDTPNRVILSGTFFVQYLKDGVVFPVTIKDGRFDFGITNEFFYSIP